MVKQKSEKSELKAVIPHCTTYVGHKAPICFQLCIYVKQTVTCPSRCTPIPQLPLEKTWGWGWGWKGHLGCIRTAWTFKCNYIFHCIIKKKGEPFIVPLRLLRVCYMHVLADLSTPQMKERRVSSLSVLGLPGNGGVKLWIPRSSEGPGGLVAKPMGFAARKLRSLNCVCPSS